MKEPFIKIVLYVTALAIFTIALSYSLNNQFSNISRKVNPFVVRETAAALHLQKQGDWAAAAEILGKTAYTQYPDAKVSYAFQLIRGWGVKRDLDAARQLLLQAVKQDFSGKANAAFELGRLYRLSRGPGCQKIAYQWFSKSLEWGKQKAHLELAKTHARALGVPKNIKLARYHYRAAAQNGSPSAALSLVLLIYKSNQDNNGMEDAQNVLREFLPIIEASAIKGKGRAARSLARLYAKNGIVTANISKAIYWYEKASQAGDRAAMHDLAMLALKQKKLPFSGKKIVELLRVSSDLGYSGAMTALGRLHLEKRFKLPQKKAVTWFKKGIVAGHAGSMEEMARLFLNGLIVAKDTNAALALAQQGAKLRHKGSTKLLKKINKKRSEISNNTSRP